MNKPVDKGCCQYTGQSFDHARANLNEYFTARRRDRPSGVLEAQANEVIHAYRQNIKMEIADNKEDWVLLTGVKQ